MAIRKTTPISALLTLAISTALVSCSTTEENDTPTTVADSAETTIQNCEEEVTYPADPSLFVYDSGLIAIALSAGAQDNISAIARLDTSKDALAAKYGSDLIDGYELVTEQRPSLEQIVALQPDIYVTGWNYGLNEGGVTPELLDERGIANYKLTESCRQDGTTQRGIVDPWVALETDLRNISQIAGDEAAAEEVIEDTKTRLSALEDAPQAEKTPTVFVFDSGSDTIFTSGKFGAPQAIIEAAGARNQTENIDDTWTTVGWETLAAEAPDAFVFVDYEGQEFEEKVALLKEHPVTKDLPAVQENRFINLNYVFWVSSPLNIDAAEHLRKALESYGLLEASGIEPVFDLPDSLAGKEYFVQ